MGLGPWALSLFICLVSGTFFPARWTTPDFFLVGLIAICGINPILDAKAIRRFLLTLVVFITVLWSIKFGTLHYANTHENHSDAALPNVLLAQKITALWHARYHTPLPYIIGSRYVASALTTYSPDKPIPYFGANRVESPWINEARVHQKGGVVVIDRDYHYAWDEDSLKLGEMEARIQSHFPGAQPPIPLTTLHMSQKGKPIVIWITFIAPGS
jgi:hypothetical protein